MVKSNDGPPKSSVDMVEDNKTETDFDEPQVQRNVRNKKGILSKRAHVTHV